MRLCSFHITILGKRNFLSQHVINLNNLSFFRMLKMYKSITFVYISFNQVFGENTKGMKADGSPVYKLGMTFFTKCIRTKNAYYSSEEWWLVDLDNIERQLPQPTESKLSRKRIFCIHSTLVIRGQLLSIP